eukprot:3393756-Lingulodinium_polyedra.AAC.1
MGPAKRYFSTRGGMSIALRRVMSNASAQTLGLTWGLDAHGSTISRKEIELRAALNAAARALH